MCWVSLAYLSGGVECSQRNKTTPTKKEAYWKQWHSGPIPPLKQQGSATFGEMSYAFDFREWSDIRNIYLPEPAQPTDGPDIQNNIS